MTEGAGAETIEIQEAHRFDEAALRAYLRQHLPGAEGAVEIRQFQAGQSNPTFKITAGGRQYVLRKRPGGTLLPSAHAVDREYRVQAALKGGAVPVPSVHFLCTDPDVIGTDFYVMSLVEGDIHHDPGLPGLTPAQRRVFYEDFIRALAELHKVDIEKAGLADFGKPDGYLERQVARWSRQYEASKTEEIPEMGKLADWLARHLPQDHSVSVVHGDFRPGNTIIDPATCRIKAVLDWELSTLGHPLADLGYCCASYHGAVSSKGNFAALDHAALGIPTEAEFIDLYARYSGRGEIENVSYYMVFSMFRSAAIIQGVYKRGLQGNASSDEAKGFGHLARQRAEAAWRIVETRF